MKEGIRLCYEKMKDFHDSPVERWFYEIARRACNDG